MSQREAPHFLGVVMIHEKTYKELQEILQALEGAPLESVDITLRDSIEYIIKYYEENYDNE
jgi:hypothetical protein|tara:strand:+ start:261 stop:443 length:183 start_codon:yes stop_codon:yes gene_type:complete